MQLFRPLAILALLAAPLAAQTPAPASPAAAPAPRPRPAKLDYDSLEFGRQFTTWFYSAQVDSLWAHTDSAMRAQMGTKEGWNEPLSQFMERVGSELSLVEERWMIRNGARQYIRVFNGSEFTQEPVALRWVLRPGKMVAGSGMNPLSRMPPADPDQ